MYVSWKLRFQLFLLAFWVILTIFAHTKIHTHAQQDFFFIKPFACRFFTTISPSFGTVIVAHQDHQNWHSVVELYKTNCFFFLLCCCKLTQRKRHHYYIHTNKIFDLNEKKNEMYTPWMCAALRKSACQVCHSNPQRQIFHSVQSRLFLMHETAIKRPNRLKFKCRFMRTLLIGFRCVGVAKKKRESELCQSWEESPNPENFLDASSERAEVNRLLYKKKVNDEDGCFSFRFSRKTDWLIDFHWLLVTIFALKKRNRFYGNLMQKT